MKILKYLDNKIWLFTTAILLISSWYFNIIIIYNIIIAILYGIYEYFPVIYDSSIVVLLMVLISAIVPVISIV